MKNEKFAATLSVDDAAYTYYPVEQVEGSEKLPYALKVLLENVLRNAESPEAASDLAKRVVEAGCAGEVGSEVEFSPARVLFQDFTGVPVFVDFAVMREACANLGGDPAKINPQIPCDLVIDPAQFDVVVFPNLYGDIASDLAAGLVGGLGIAPGANIGKEYAVFEAVHGSAPDIAGQNKANPTAEIMSAAMMLDHLGELEIAERIRRGVRAVYADGSVLTGDIRKATGSSAPAASCTEFTEALIAAIKAQA